MNELAPQSGEPWRSPASLRVRPIQEALASLPAATTVLVAVDGRAGSGKTTLANELAREDPNIRIFHADELQRPQAEGEWENWTPRESAAKFVREEALRDVLSKVAAGQEAEYQPFDWSTHEVGPPRVLSPGGVLVVEGAYTLRQSLRADYDLEIWVECAEDVRAARLRARPAPSPGWLEAWVRGENFYIEQEHPDLAADMVIRGDGQ